MDQMNIIYALAFVSKIIVSSSTETSASAQTITEAIQHAGRIYNGTNILSDTHSTGSAVHTESNRSTSVPSSHQMSELSVPTSSVTPTVKSRQSESTLKTQSIFLLESVSSSQSVSSFRRLFTDLPPVAFLRGTTDHPGQLNQGLVRPISIKIVTPSSNIFPAAGIENSDGNERSANNETSDIADMLFEMVAKNDTTNMLTEMVANNDTNVNYNINIYGNRQFAVLSYKYITPAIISVCLTTTIVFMLVIGKRMRSGSSMSRASCLLLMFIASADALTMVFAMAELTYLYSETRDTDMLLPFSSCGTMFVLERLSPISHAASTWFTVILAIQRYICVALPFLAEKYINMKLTIALASVVTSLSLSLHACTFFDTQFSKINVHDSISPQFTTETCQSSYLPWVEDPVLYESLFAWIRISVTQLIPCLLIVIFVVLMLKALRNRNIATKRMNVTETRRRSERRSISVFVISMSSIVFCVELSDAVFLGFYACGISTGKFIFSYVSLKTASIGFDIVLYVSYFIAFILYCLMSGEFRQIATYLCRESDKSKQSSNCSPNIPLKISHVK